MIQAKTSYDAIIIGGGPAGATSALVMARAGLRVLVVEKVPFPRFHVGESFLPRNFALLQELGLEPALRKMPHMSKFGAEFGLGHAKEETTRFSFDQGLDGGGNETFNSARAPFDAMLLDAARAAGARVIENTTVKKILKLADDDVMVSVDDEPYTARYLIDASGQATVVGKHLDTRRTLKNHRKVAYFGHFENVKRLSGREEGYPTVAMCDEGWFWLIPIDEKRTSIGLVMDVDAAKQVEVPANEMLFWGIARCPLVRERAARAVFPKTNHVNADFSYTCAPYAGPGYFLVGDAAVFLDPIFSTGICLGMMGAVEAAKSIIQMLGGTLHPQTARKRYSRFVHGSSSVFFRLVNHYYNHSFRELFLHGCGPFQVHRGIISILAGHVFPRPVYALRWRLRLFEGLIWLQRRFAVVQRRESFSLLTATLEKQAPQPVTPSARLAAEPVGVET